MARKSLIDFWVGSEVVDEQSAMASLWKLIACWGLLGLVLGPVGRSLVIANSKSKE